MAPAFLGLLLFGRKESYRWLVTMSFAFLDVFSCQFAKEILRDLPYAPRSLRTKSR